MNFNPYHECIKEQIATVLIRAYVTHSWIYYEMDDSIISDGEFEQLCGEILENYDWIKPYDINDYLNPELLNCGSGFGLKLCGLSLDAARSTYEKYRNKPKSKPKETQWESDIL